MSKYIVLIGNISDGYDAVGPFDDIEEAFSYSEFQESWIMTLYEAKEYDRQS